MPCRAFITGLSGLALTAEERAFVRESEPWGFILFKRNVDAPDQVRRLTGECREAVGRNAPILVDQEGGRVQRLGPPHWPSYPPGAAYGRIFQQQGKAAAETAAKLGARLIAADLRAVGIDVDCLPIADVPVPDADRVIGDRAYGDTPAQVAAIARSVSDGLLAGGVLPVLKHIPGHGRATADSHAELPVVDTDLPTLERTDFPPFRALCDLPLAMTAHVVFTTIDALAPATTSAKVVDDVIRKWIGFRGLLMSDDISMGALSGSIGERSRAALAAGCDLVLHCNGNLDEMRKVAAMAPMLAGDAARRSDDALKLRASIVEYDCAADRARFVAIMAQVSAAAVMS